MLAIETGIPVPAGDARGKKPSALTVALRQLKPGDSVAAPAANAAALAALSKRAFMILGAGQYVCKRINDQEARIWRR